jgi:hypothetical protein
MEDTGIPAIPVVVPHSHLDQDWMQNAGSKRVPEPAVAVVEPEKTESPVAAETVVAMCEPIVETPVVQEPPRPVPRRGRLARVEGEEN